MISLNDVIEQCKFLFHNYPQAELTRSYLNSRLHPIIQEQWNFGYFPSSKYLSSITDLISSQDLISLKLLYSFESKLISFFEHHPLILPYKDTYGNVIGLVGRTLLSEDDRQKKNIFKYKNTFFHKGNYLFGLYENKLSILKQGFVYLVEGQIDVIKATSIGLTNIVAMGNAFLTSYQFSLIMRYTNNIHLLLDNDSAGLKGRKAAHKKYGKLANFQNFFLPDIFKDIDEYISQENIQDYTQLQFIYKNI